MSTTKYLSNDLQLLIACCQTNLSADDIAFIHNSLSTINYQLLTKLANQHGILPLVYQGLKKHVSNIQHPRSNIQHFLSNLKPSYMEIVRRNMLMTAELLCIMKLLKENGIVSLAFKGPTLAQLAYGNITLRQYGDLDIFIHVEDIVKISQILYDKGYQTDIDKKYFIHEFFLEVNSDIQFYKAGILIEIHWSLFRKRFLNHINNEYLWKQHNYIDIQKSSIPIFSNESLLVYLCMHGSKHAWERIEWIADIHKLISSSKKLNWDKVLEIAIDSNSKTMFNLGLSLSYKLFSTKLPEHIIIDIQKNNRIQILQQKIFTFLKINIDSSAKNEYQRMYRDFIFYYQLNDNLSNKLSFLPRAIFTLTPEDITFVNFKKPNIFFYHIIRPIRIIIKSIKYLLEKYL